MTVAECIALLEKIDDKSVPVFIDCSHCGKANEFGEVKEIVLIRSREPVR